jgi:hypothetical protein
MLPGLTPAHTRKSFHHSSNPASGGSRLYVEKLAPTPESFIVSPETGLWLLPAGVAEVDVVRDSKRIEWITARRQNRRLELAARVLGRSSVDQMGCVVGGLRGNQTPAQLILELAELEMGTLTLNTGEDIPHISLCGNPDCYNARHSQLEFGSAKYAKRTVELNPHWYIPTDSGEIETIWGDILPPVDVSLRYFIDFQRQNFPFVPIDRSALTPTPMSQILFHPLTGCWESFYYETNTSGLANIKNGYGVMYARQAPDQLDYETGEITPGFRRGSVLAHNLIWQVTGHEVDANKERNHFCNYTRCCNPLHIEQINADDNRSHGHRARAIIRAQERCNPASIGYFLDKETLHMLYRPLRALYADITQSMPSSVI